jgi:hypothetical protein
VATPQRAFDNAKRSARRPLAAGNHLPLHMRVSA